MDLISCLCVTRGDRPTQLADATADFLRQTYPNRELVILHDGDDAADAGIRSIVAARPSASIKVARVPAGPKLGGLRNLAVARASGEWICQWDDDDRHHPDRLRLQWERARTDGSAACFLVDQLHWFEPAGALSWDDWGREPFPIDFVQGTILARRAVMPPYPDLPRGEDTIVTHALARSEARGALRISRLRDAGWCYVYRFHGKNAWSSAHHQAISHAKAMSAARLLPRLAFLQQKLIEYDPPLPRLRLPLGSGLQDVVLGAPDGLRQDPSRSALR